MPDDSSRNGDIVADYIPWRWRRAIRTRRVAPQGTHRPVLAPGEEIEKVIKAHYGVGGDTVEEMVDTKGYVPLLRRWVEIRS